MNTYRNTPFDALEVGMEASAQRLCRAEDFLVYASSSGNHNPVHLPKSDHDGDGKADEPIAPSMWVASLISSVLGNQLPGPGTLYDSQSLRFLGRAHAGDELTVHVRLTEKRDERIAVFVTTITKADGTPIVEGEATVIAPAAGMSFEADDLPGLTVQRHVHFDRLLELAEPLPPCRPPWWRRTIPIRLAARCWRQSAR
ncbi:MaoC/PaaZ C-terminal domain-containing protein [Roseitalea porphyridii]|uniref:MaoC/PaaZ C-terminal domain-containing protein n=1 Tax=Roseitalea porphyridii TaxID=1852022 RepID=UPI001FCE8B8A|nr:MaoC/PaaZ C-terminal domain-containing protein [Roseitalea porphyridii]